MVREYKILDITMNEEKMYAEVSIRGIKAMIELDEKNIKEIFPEYDPDITTKEMLVSILRGKFIKTNITYPTDEREKRLQQRREERKRKKHKLN
jgi:hypothetical protein